MNDEDEYISFDAWVEKSTNTVLRLFLIIGLGSWFTTIILSAIVLAIKYL